MHLNRFRTFKVNLTPLVHKRQHLSNNMAPQTHFKLNTGAEIPAVGLGNYINLFYERLLFVNINAC